MKIEMFKEGDYVGIRYQDVEKSKLRFFLNNCLFINFILQNLLINNAFEEMLIDGTNVTTTAKVFRDMLEKSMPGISTPDKTIPTGEIE